MGEGNMNLPDMIRVRKTFSTQAVTDIASEVAPQFEKLDLRNRARRGASVAVGCSSRGIANYNTIVKATVDCLSRAGLEPFLFPAMGSHGAATAQGQKSVLEGYGITESFIGAPIRSSLETVQVGETDDQVPVFVDRIASEADHIVLVNRIKPHTDFEHEFESGLLKMMAIGLGKEHGATIYHRAIMTVMHRQPESECWAPTRSSQRKRCFSKRPGCSLPPYRSRTWTC
jgi:hypothetical protein